MCALIRRKQRQDQSQRLFVVHSGPLTAINREFRCLLGSARNYGETTKIRRPCGVRPKRRTQSKESANGSKVTRSRSFHQSPHLAHSTLRATAAFWRTSPVHGPTRERVLRVDLTRSPGFGPMSAMCAKQTAGVDVKRTLRIAGERACLVQDRPVRVLRPV
jgi:hypothetical protein